MKTEIFRQIVLQSERNTSVLNLIEDFYQTVSQNKTGCFIFTPLSTEPSSTQLESLDEDGHKSGTEDSPSPSQSQTSGGESDILEQNSQPGREEPAEEQDAEKHDPVSSSSSSSSSEEGVSSAEPASACSSSSTEPTAEGSSSAENSSDSSETADDPMEQD